ncbi:hypothetical protein [Streptomyces sp. NPDC002738]
MAKRDWDFTLAPGGWVRVRDDGAPSTTVYMLLRGKLYEDGRTRYAVHTVVMDSQSPISTHALRDVPFQAVEDLANRARFRWVESFSTFIGEALAPDLAGVAALERHFDDESVLDLGFLLDEDEAGVPEAPPPLERPPGRITDEFLALLAQMYRYRVALQDPAPSTTIGAEVGAPVATVRRWINMARKAGFLPPGRPGRAG